MVNGPLGLEHPLVVSDDLDALAGRYRAMGFATAPKGYHPWGTANHLVLFPGSFIELMGIDGRGLLDTPSETGFRFGRFIADQLDRREGVAMIALHSDDVAADVAGVTARGTKPDGLVDFRRAVTLADGAKEEVAFSLAMLIDWQQPQLSHFLCQHHRPEFVWVPEWMQHPNGAQAIAEVAYAAAEPHAHRQRFAGIWGEDALHDEGNGFRVSTAGGDLVVLGRPAAEARFAPVEMPYGWSDAACAVAITVRVADINRVHLMMMQNGVPHVRMAEVLRIPPSYAGNVILDFAS